MQEASFAGPIPPPDLLKGYEEVCPGAAQRIISMAEVQSEHRRALEKQMGDAAVEEMRSQFVENRRGQYLAAAIAFAFLIAGVYLAFEGNPWPGAIIGGIGGGGIGLPAIVAAFLRRSEGADGESEKVDTPVRSKSIKRKRR